MAKEETKEPSTRTPDEWSLLLAVPRWQHMAARQLHQWHVHEHHEGQPMQLSKAAYTEALAAVLVTPCKAHAAALSPHAGKGL